jgi:hypothetical protein
MVKPKRCDYWERIHSNSHVSLWEYQTNGKRLSQTRPKSLISTILLRYFNQLGHIHQLKLGIAIGSSAKLSTVYYANRFWIT